MDILPGSLLRARARAGGEVKIFGFYKNIETNLENKQSEHHVECFWVVVYLW